MVFFCSINTRRVARRQFGADDVRQLAADIALQWHRTAFVLEIEYGKLRRSSCDYPCAKHGRKSSPAGAGSNAADAVIAPSTVVGRELAGSGMRKHANVELERDMARYSCRYF
jgi:hypothetical protein